MVCACDLCCPSADCIGRFGIEAARRDSEIGWTRTRNRGTGRLLPLPPPLPLVRLAHATSPPHASPLTAQPPPMHHQPYTSTHQTHIAHMNTEGGGMPKAEGPSREQGPWPVDRSAPIHHAALACSPSRSKPRTPLSPITTSPGTGRRAKPSASGSADPLIAPRRGQAERSCEEGNREPGQRLTVGERSRRGAGGREEG
jgi:hypothetical protein